jgi:hypothetical protein
MYGTGPHLRWDVSLVIAAFEAELDLAGDTHPRRGCMPRYYFHIHNGYELELDPVGADLPDLKAARSEAERITRDVSRFWPQARRYMMIEIADEAGQTIVRLPFADVMGLPE